MLSAMRSLSLVRFGLAVISGRGLKSRMLSMGWAFVVFTTLLLCGDVAYTILWFWQAGARVRRVEEVKGWRRL